MSTIKEFYDNHSFKYEEFEAEALTNKDKYPLLYTIRNRERELLSKGKDKKVFYFATGSGSDIVHLTKMGAKVVTLDFSIEMINRTCDRLKKEDIGYSLLKDKTELTPKFMDDFFENNKGHVLILLADTHDIKFPQDYFDYIFCYCTLPLLSDKTMETLKELLRISKNGAVSVYDKDKLPILHQYYIDFGFNSQIINRTIYLEGGFEYYAIPSSEVKETIEKEKKLEIIEIGIGKIYLWS